MDFALCVEPRGLSRRGAAPLEAGGSCIARGGRRRGNAQLRGYGADRGAGICQVCGRGMDREEHLHHQSAEGVVALSGGNPHLGGIDGRCAGAGPMRKLHALY